MNQLHNKHGPSLGRMFTVRSRDGTFRMPRDRTGGMPRDGTVGRSRDGTNQWPSDVFLPDTENTCIYYSFTILTKPPGKSRLNRQTHFRRRKKPGSKPPLGSGKAELCPVVRDEGRGAMSERREERGERRKEIGTSS